MRLTALEFAGYGSGATDFSALLASTAQGDLPALTAVLDMLAGQVVAPVGTRSSSIIVVGHSDRQDRSDLTCDARRASEIAAATDRAVSAWQWIKAQVSERTAQSGVDAGEWWETTPQVTWGLVFAAAGMLHHDPPSGEQERAANRRVVLLVSMFAGE